MYTIRPRVSLYPKPEHGKLADEVLFGTYVEIQDETNGFYYVRTEYNYCGYLAVSDVADSPEPNRMVSDLAADVLTQPSYKSTTAATLFAGSLVKAYQELEGFTAIDYHGGTGFIRSAHLCDTQPSFKIPNSEWAFRRGVVRTALRFMGTGYRWGGKTVLGIDCSGLAFMSYALNGVYIFRDSRIEPDFPIKPIPLFALKPADLIFSPGHVMIYLGQGRYIHSSMSNSGVAINSLEPGHKAYRKDIAETITGYGSLWG